MHPGIISIEHRIYEVKKNKTMCIFAPFIGFLYDKKLIVTQKRERESV